MNMVKYLINKLKIWFSANMIVWDKCPIKNKMFLQIADSTVRIAHDTLMYDNYHDDMVIHDTIAEQALWDAYKNFSVDLWQIPEVIQNEYFELMYENLLKMLEDEYGYIITD